MRAKKLWLALLVMTVIGLSVSACGAGEDESSVYSFDGIKEIHISVSATSYDFAENVKGFKNLEETTFEVDSSAVKFKTAGKYEVKYTIDKFEQTADVYIYAEPVFASVSNTITYADAQSTNGLLKGLSVKDSFDNDLTPVVTEGITAGAGGYIEYGDHLVKYSASDKAGNTKTYSRTVTVSDSDKPVFEDINVDLSDIESPINFGSHRISKLYFDSEVIGAEEFVFINGYLSFKEAFILGEDLGAHALKIVTSGGYNNATLNITDEQPATFNLNVYDVDYANTVSFAKAEKFGHQKNITFSYEVTDSLGNAVAVTETDTHISFAPGLESVFEVKAHAWRNGTEDAGSKQATVKIHDNVYAWAVNSKNVYEDVKFSADMRTSYATDRANGNDVGSTYIQNTASAGAGIVMINFRDADNVAAESAFEFFVYNPSGVALTADIYTTSTYWNTQPGLNTLSNAAVIPAEAGWHKVSLKLKNGFDGLLNSITGKNPGDADTQIRIYTDGWVWDKAQVDFGIYVSNIYLKKEASAYNINYGTTGFINSGLMGREFQLPQASSDDLRIRFEYSLTKGGQPFDFDEDGFTFGAEESGDYIFTATAYLRDTVVDSKATSFGIENATMKLAVAAYYTFDAENKVTLPAAMVGGGNDDKAVRYSVRLDEGEWTVLGENRVFTTSVNGIYTYKAEVLDTDGTTVLDTATIPVKLHASNVLVGFGRDAAEVNQEKLGMNVNAPAAGFLTSFTYTTDIAAPGEIGSMRISNELGRLTEKGNMPIQLGHIPVAGKTMITFWIYHTAPQNLSVRMYGGSGFFNNFWYNGQNYSGTGDLTTFPIAPSASWQKIEFVVGAGPISGSDIRLNFMTSNYGQDWPADAPAEIYISNIYYS